MSEWINCMDSQPREGQCVLVFDERETHSSMYTIQCSDIMIACIRGDEFKESFAGITHWMPLPEPPECKQ